MPNAKAYRKAWDRSRERALALSREAGGDLVRMLGDLQRDMVRRVAAAAGTDGTLAVRMIPRINADLAAAVEEFASRADPALAEQIRAAWASGEARLPAMLADAGIRVPPGTIGFGGTTPEILKALVSSASDSFHGMLGDLSERAIGEVRRAAVGLAPVSEASRGIERAIGIGAEGRRIGAAYQAEAIATTETMRAFSAANQSTSEQLAKAIPGLRKSWITAGHGDRREGHIDAEKRYAVGGSTGPILVSEAFEVTDHSRTGESEFFTFGGRVRPKGWTGGQRVVRTERRRREGSIVVDSMLFPRDPSASAGNVVMCRCDVFHVVPGLEEGAEPEPSAAPSPAPTPVAAPAAVPAPTTLPDLRKATLAEAQAGVAPLVDAEVRILEDRLASYELKLDEIRSAATAAIDSNSAGRQEWMRLYDQRNAVALGDKAGYDRITALMADVDVARNQAWARYQGLLADAKVLEKEKVAETLKILAPQDAVGEFKVVSNSRAISGQRLRVAEEGFDAWGQLLSEKALDGGVWDSYGVTASRTTSFHKGGQTVEISMTKRADVPTYVHELSHALETRNPRIMQRNLAFFESRTAGDPLVRMPEWGSGVVGKPDKFFSTYCGRDYTSRYTGKKYGTEILSMGVERYLTDPLGFYYSDPEYYRFVWGVMHGVI